MSFSLAATLRITCGTVPHRPAPKKAKVPADPAAHHQTHPQLVDPMEGQLSPEILAMQHRIRETKRSELDDQAALKRDKPKVSTVKAQIDSKQQPVAEKDDKGMIEHRWETASLADVQPSDLEAMDLTGLPRDLLEHPKGASVDYTEEEKKAVQALFEKKVKRRSRTSHGPHDHSKGSNRCA